MAKASLKLILLYIGISFIIFLAGAFSTRFMELLSEDLYYCMTGKPVIPDEVNVMVTSFKKINKGFEGEVVFSNQSLESVMIKHISIRLPHPSESRARTVQWVDGRTGIRPKSIILQSKKMLHKEFAWQIDLDEFITSNSSFLGEGEKGEPCCYLDVVIEFHIIDSSGGKHIVPYSPFRIHVTNNKIGPMVHRRDTIKLLPSPETKRPLL